MVVTSWGLRLPVWGSSVNGLSLARLAVPILILGVPIFDTTLTTIVRVKWGQVKTIGAWLRFTGRDHFHHRLCDLGIGDRKAVLVTYLISFWLSLESLVLKNARGINAILSIVQVGIMFLLIGLFMVFVQNRYQRLAPDPLPGDGMRFTTLEMASMPLL